jgi:hypothetical protein
MSVRLGCAREACRVREELYFCKVLLPFACWNTERINAVTCTAAISEIEETLDKHAVLLALKRPHLPF